MKKSRIVPAYLIASMAAGTTVTGCDSNPSYACHDRYGRPIPDIGCRNGTVVGAHWVQTGGFGGSGGYWGGGGG